MRAIVQRVREAKVKIKGKTVGEIGHGLLVLIGIIESDDNRIMEWMCNKLVNLRIFRDSEGNKNKSVLDINGGILIVSNYTVYGSVKKGFRPNYMKSAPAEISEPLYNRLIEYLRKKYPINIKDGEFGAMMDIELINDGPVTIVIDKENN
ncbi:D-aminoacyl-tRNA deacylase [Bacteroidota bacterium]